MKHKARLVARGFTQKPSVEYDQTYAPIAWMQTFRAVIAIAVHFDWTH